MRLMLATVRMRVWYSPDPGNPFGCNMDPKILCTHMRMNEHSCNALPYTEPIKHSAHKAWYSDCRFAHKSKYVIVHSKASVYQCACAHICVRCAVYAGVRVNENRRKRWKFQLIPIFQLSVSFRSVKVAFMRRSQMHSPPNGNHRNNFNLLRNASKLACERHGRKKTYAILLGLSSAISISGAWAEREGKNERRKTSFIRQA